MPSQLTVHDPTISCVRGVSSHSSMRIFVPSFDFPGSNSKRARAWGVDREGDSREGSVSGAVVVVEREAGGEGRVVDMLDGI